VTTGSRPTPGRGRLRTAHTLDIQGWVLELAPAEIYMKLVRRIEALDAAIRPYRDGLVQGSRVVAERLMGQLEGRVPPLDPLPPHADVAVARLIGANIVADYWAGRPYASRRCLPPIVTVGVPWAVWPDRVHFLDLSPELTRRALLRSRALADIDRATRAPAQLPPAPALLGASAMVFVRLLHSAAVLVPVFQQALYTLLVTAHYAPEKPEAEAAARMAGSLFHALLPDLSRHMTRRPDQLAQVRRAFEATLPKATRLHAALATDGVTPAGVSWRARCSAPACRVRTSRAGSVSPRVISRWPRSRPGCTRRARRSRISSGCGRRPTGCERAGRSSCAIGPRSPRPSGTAPSSSPSAGRGRRSRPPGGDAHPPDRHAIGVRHLPGSDGSAPIRLHKLGPWT